MPCEACNAQFTVFKRKKSCTECRRLYCNQCLIKRKERALCDRCVVFTTRPLSKVELLKLKPKDLIFYLQSKHISTTGCVEKEELVNLVLNHVNNSSTYGSDSSGGGGRNHNNETDENSANPFDQLKQTCQNLFTSFTEKIASDLNFDIKSSSTGQNQNIFSQPRASTRPDGQHSGQEHGIGGVSISSSNSFASVPHSPNYEQPTSQPHSPPPSAASVPRSNSNQSTKTQSTRNRPPPRSNTSSGGPSSPISPVFSVHSSVSSSVSASSAGGPTTKRGSASRSAGTTNNVRSPTGMPSVHSTNRNKTANQRHIDLSNVATCGSGCECSDDELITKFHKSYSKTTTPTIEVNIQMDVQEAGPSGSTPSVPKPVTKESGDSSDASSFEELGATGGGGGGGRGFGTSTDTDNWQFVSKSTLTDSPPPPVQKTSTMPSSPPPPPSPLPSSTAAEIATASTSGRQLLSDGNDADTTNTTKSQINLSNLTFHPTDHSLESTSLNNILNTRRLTRRRSDTVVYVNNSSAMRRSFNCDNSDDGNGDNAGIGNISGGGGFGDAEMSRKRTKTSCDKCGKSKVSLRRHVAKFRRQLESTNATEAEIKEQLDAFLLYLESCNRNSVDCSDSEDSGAGVIGLGGASSGAGVGGNGTVGIGGGVSHSNGERGAMLTSIRNFGLDTVLLGSRHGAEDDDDDEDDDGVDGIEYDYDDNFSYGDDEGIHVYGTDDTSGSSTRAYRSYVELTDYQESCHLDELTVKQLKEILMRNRVDFKGCCEKTELLDRAKRLWNEYNSCPAVDKLPSDDLCKICMDAPIECVILECGHMATCTSCGKVLSECPICRQYIVRVVRFFRA